MKELPVINTDRRGFLKTTCAALCTLPLAAILAGCETDELKIIAPTGKEVVININNEPALQNVGGAVRKTFPEVNSGRQLLILRTSQTEFLVVSAVCPHEQGEIQPPDNPGENLYCAKHGSEFSPINGAVLTEPSPTGLTRFSDVVYDLVKNTLTIKY